MNELPLDPCPHCDCPRLQIARFKNAGGDVMAVMCRACGGRGPLCPITEATDMEALEALVSLDWNRRISTERPALEAKTETPERVPPVEPPAVADELGAAAGRKPDNGGETATQPDSSPRAKAINSGMDSLQAPSPPKKPSTPGDGGGEGTRVKVSAKPPPPKRTPDGIPNEQLEVGDRLARFLGDVDLDSKTVGQKYALGASHFTLWKILNGQRVSPATVGKVSAALDALEKKSPPEVAQDEGASHPGKRPLYRYEEDQVQTLPNHLPAEYTPPKLQPPARCSRTT